MDATNLEKAFQRTFDVIVFNLPQAEMDSHDRNQNELLVSNFLKSATSLMDEESRIHLTLHSIRNIFQAKR